MQRSPEIGPSHADAKAYGTFYTDAQIAEFLAWWGIRTGTESVLDPSFGGGVFLRAAAKRIHGLGRNPRQLVHGVEIDHVVHRSISKKLGDEFGIPPQNLMAGDFFHQQGAARFNVVVGNPPFIRYQNFSGESRQIALKRALALGVRLSELSSAWAPFLVAGIAQLRPGGRLAMVAPAELCHAGYAKPVLEYLGRTFERVTFLTFEQPLFPDISESTILVLAENRGDHQAVFRHRDFQHPGALSPVAEKEGSNIPGAKSVDAEALQSGDIRFIQYLIPRKCRELYAELSESAGIKLGQVADVGIGYVSGANDFFHVGPDEVSKWDLPEPFLKPIIRRSRALRGVSLTRRDWRENLRTGEASYLLHVTGDQPLPQQVRRYIEDGESQGFHLGYKCRNRTPWYRVPHVRRPDAFLSYMSTRSPRLVANEAEVFAPNSLHGLRLHQQTEFAPESLAGAWQTSFTRLSCELQGHALGGGMLKLEPTEAERTMLPKFAMDPLEALALTAEIDRWLRTSDDARAQAEADRFILRDRLNLTKAECSLLSDAVISLQRRRTT
jgi:adenine-specific DNA-methyltransferase